MSFAIGDRVRFTRCDLVGRGGTIRGICRVDGQRVLTIMPDGSATTVERLESCVRCVVEDEQDTDEWPAFVPCAVDVEPEWKAP